MSKYKQTVFFMLILLIYLCIIPFILPIILIMLDLKLSDDVILFFTPFLCSLIPIIFYFYATKENITDVLRIKKIGIKNLLLIIMMSFFIQPVLNFIALITSFIFPNSASEVMSSISNIPFMNYILVAAILPAIFEELLFRGIILSGCKKVGILKSALISGIFFGIMHLDPHQFIYAFIAGAIFSIFVVYSDSIFASIAAHFVINFTQAVLVYIATNSYSAELASETTNYSIKSITALGILFLICLVIFITILLYFIKINKKNIAPSQYDKKENVMTISFAIIIIVYICYLFLINFIKEPLIN